MNMVFVFIVHRMNKGLYLAHVQMAQDLNLNPNLYMQTQHIIHELNQVLSLTNPHTNHQNSRHHFTQA